MKLKKYLQQQVDKDIENLLSENDLEFCNQLAEDVQERPVKIASRRPKVKLWAALSSALAVVLLVVIIVPLTVTKNRGFDVFYQEENIVSKTCSLEEMNDGLNAFSVEQNEGTSYTVKLYYDSVSNDSLYYEVKALNVLFDIDIFIVINDKYDFNFELNDGYDSEQLQGYILKYSKTSSGSLNGNDSRFKGIIELNSEIAYIEYKQNIDLGEQAFFGDIQSILKVKN